MKQKENKLFLFITIISFFVIIFFVIHYSFKFYKNTHVSWHTYQDAGLGLEVQYPVGWMSSSIDESVLDFERLSVDCSKRGCSRAAIYQPKFEIRVSQTNAKSTEQFVSDFNKPSSDGMQIGLDVKKELEISGVPAMWVEVCGAGSQEQGPVVVHGGKVYKIMIPAFCFRPESDREEWIESEIEYKPIFDQMIQSIKFLD